jgi:hypothetical protein
MLQLVYKTFCNNAKFLMLLLRVPLISICLIFPSNIHKKDEKIYQIGMQGDAY